MPYARAPLTELRTQVLQQIASALPGSDPLLPYSNLNILGQVLAGLSHLHYGYLDWIAQQSNPFTATDEFLEAWAGLKGVVRLPATRASGFARFSGVNGTVLPANTLVVRGDGKAYVTTADGTVALGTVVVLLRAAEDPAGLSGAAGNCPAGTTLTLGTTVAGVSAAGEANAAITGGADLETDDSLRVRMLQAYQNPPNGGSRADYETWALSVPGVTRSWCVPNAYGPGTVTVYVMLDAAQAAFGGFPQGTNGGATGEPRNTDATGDQLSVANYIFPLQPVTALVFVLAPTPNVVNFTISGLAAAGSVAQNAVRAAIQGVFSTYGTLAAGATTVPLSFIQAAIAAVPGTAGFLITSPAGNIVSAAGSLPVLGTTTWT